MSRTARSLSSLLRASYRATAALALATGCASTSTGPRGLRMVTTAPESLGAGLVHTYATLDADERPVSIGVALSDSALAGLPTDALPGMPPGRMLTLPLPPEAKAVGFDHVMLNWNAMGHDPVQIYGLPHMDVHFYTIDLARQLAMSPADPQFEVKGATLPASVFVPATYVRTGAVVPTMGAHWVDPASPELQPPPAAQRTPCATTPRRTSTACRSMVSCGGTDAARRTTPAVAR